MRGFTPKPRPRRPLAWTIRDGGALVALVGDFDERSDFEAVAREVGGSKISIDLGGVGRINSIGVSYWVRFVEAITRPRGRTVALCSVPGTFAAAAALVPAMRGGVSVESLQMAYRCDACNREEEALVRSAAEVSLGRRCANCGAAMDRNMDGGVALAVLGA